MDKYKIADLRLAVAASFGRPGKRVADIGTDHASLPIFLVGNGVTDSALACDVNIGPLNAAKRNIEAAGLSDKINTKLTDGLEGIADFKPEDIYILGMGGELIWRIIENSELPRSEGIRLILQPMTHAHDLRQGLYGSGFNIVDETLTRDRDRVYQIIVAEYDGVVRSATQAESWLGKLNIAKGGAELEDLAKLYASALDKKIKGYAEAGKNDPETSALYEAFNEIAKNGKQR